MSDSALAAQFSGPYVQSLMAAVDQILGQRDPTIAYLYDLSIDTADSPQLDTIGGIIGYPWPNAPTGIFDDNVFQFVTASGVIINPLMGFSALDGSGGGLFSSASPAVGNKVPIAFYRLLLTQVAYLKSHGLTFKAIDQICHVFGPDYFIDTVADSSFLLGSASTFPELDAIHGLSGASPPYDAEGGLLSGVGLTDSDIHVTFITEIGAGMLYIIQSVFDRFTTAPQVFVSQGD